MRANAPWCIAVLGSDGWSVERAALGQVLWRGQTVAAVRVLHLWSCNGLGVAVGWRVSARRQIGWLARDGCSAERLALLAASPTCDREPRRATAANDRTTRETG